MAKKAVKSNLLVALLVVVAVLGYGLIGKAGNLEPTAGPAPTMKTLDEVEARIPIGSITTPGNTSNQYIISNPGSYYLTGNLTAQSAMTMILVDADNVKIDLNGYSLDGNSVGTDAILIQAGMKNTTICNGNIHNWSSSGINGKDSSSTHVENIIAEDMGRLGFYLRSNSTAIGCSAINCSQGYSFGANSTLTRCIARDCTGQGIYLGDNSVLTEFSASNNKYNGIFAKGNCIIVKCISIDNGSGGISTEDNARISDCIANGNGESSNVEVHGIRTGIGSTVTGNTANNNGNSATAEVYGIYAGNDCTVTDNTANNNGDSAIGWVYGIKAHHSSTVSGNTTCNNGKSAHGRVYGIRTFNNCTVTGNTSGSNGSTTTGDTVAGIFPGVGSTVIGNTASGSSTSSPHTAYGFYLAGNSLVDQNTAYDNKTRNMLYLAPCTFGLNHTPQ